MRDRLRRTVWRLASLPDWVALMAAVLAMVAYEMAGN